MIRAMASNLGRVSQNFLHANVRWIVLIQNWVEIHRKRFFFHCFCWVSWMNFSYCWRSWINWTSYRASWPTVFVRNICSHFDLCAIRSWQLVAIYGLKLKLKFDIDEKVNNQCWLNFLSPDLWSTSTQLYDTNIILTHTNQS
jgi:hypothetical protein